VGEVGVADEPRHLGERRTEGRPVDRDPALAGLGALDQPDAERRRGRPGLGRQGRLERGDVQRGVADLGRGRPPPARERLAQPRVLADLGRPGQSQLAGRRHVREPADVGLRAVARDVDRPDRAAVERPGHVDVEPGGRSDPHRAVAGRRVAVGRGRAEPGRGGDAVTEGELVAERDRGEDQAGSDGEQAREDQPADEPLPAHRRLAEPSPGEPEAGEQAGPQQPQNPRVRGLDRRQERLHAARPDLARDVGYRRDEDEQRSGREPDHRGERPRPARHGRPLHAGQGDDGGEEGRQPDGDVDRSARSVRDQDETGADDPAGRQGHPDQTQLERPDAHGGESTGRPSQARSQGGPPGPPRARFSRRRRRSADPVAESTGPPRTDGSS
jgi:hypothetical protein